MARQAPGAPDGMRRVFERFARWRKSHTGRVPIPEALSTATGGAGQRVRGFLLRIWPRSPSLMAQGNHHVHPHRTARRHISGHQRETAQEHGNRNISHRIRRADSH